MLTFQSERASHITVMLVPDYAEFVFCWINMKKGKQRFICKSDGNNLVENEIVLKIVRGTTRYGPLNKHCTNGGACSASPMVQRLFKGGIFMASAITCASNPFNMSLNKYYN